MLNDHITCPLLTVIASKVFKIKESLVLISPQEIRPCFRESSSWLLRDCYPHAKELPMRNIIPNDDHFIIGSNEEDTNANYSNI